MEAVMLSSSSLEKSISPYKQMKNLNRVSQSFVSRPSENMPPMSNIHGGLLSAPPPPPSLSFSYPPFYQIQNQQQNHHHHLLRQQQPPLLPLPISQPLPARSRSLSESPSPKNRKTNKSRDQSLTPKKSKSKAKKDLKPAEASIVEAKASSASVGPDPKNLPKDMSRILSSSFTLAARDFVTKDLETFPGSVIFTLSPHPSSLPLPKFSLRPKISCKAEAAGIDTGATNDLRRMLRLR